jgi:hypothetical protein
MKTEEDEAFDELAKRQGMWGGGFPAKRAMAKARIDDDDDIQDYRKPWVGLTEEEWLLLGCKSVEEVRIGLAIQAKLKEKNG